MARSSHDLGGARSKRRRTLQVLAATGVFVVAAVVGLGWWLGYFTAAPEEATLQGAVDAVSADAAPPSGSNESLQTTGTEESASEVESGVSGTWTIATGNDATFVGYRINEVLTTIGDFEVVGRTGEVGGTVEISGTEIVAAEFTVDMATLTTDNDRRDAAMREQALETDRFPEASFELVDTIDLPSDVAEATPVAIEATGDLTVHGVTQRVVIPIDAQLVGSVIVVVGQLDIALTEFGIDPPEAPIVAGVEEQAVLEISLVLTRSN